MRARTENFSWRKKSTISMCPRGKEIIKSEKEREKERGEEGKGGNET